MGPYRQPGQVAPPVHAPEFEDDVLVMAVPWLGAALRLLQAWLRREPWQLGSVLALLLLALTSLGLLGELGDRLRARGCRRR